IRLPDEEVERARGLIDKLGQQISVDNVPRGLLLTMNTGLSAQVNQELVNAGIKVNALIPHEASLEETFIKLTSDSGDKGVSA
ncbi:MAG: hypothetical protein ACD_39C00861G0003, partial [uncultured bacterium]